MISLFILIISLGQILFLLATSPYPSCAANQYDNFGQLDFAAMLYNCSANIPGGLLPPSYYANPKTGVFAPTNVSVQFCINNLISVVDESNQITLDFFFRLRWTDPRVNMPGIWTSLNPHAAQDGIDITRYVYNSIPVNFWLPDITFQQTDDVQIFAETIKLYPSM